MKKRIAVFGGTFDPPHIGHIHAVISLCERHAIDEVWVIPAWQNPLKEEHHTSEDRYMMCRLAFEAVPRCLLLDIEIARPQPSFTIDTIDRLLAERADFRDADRFLFLGADAASQFFAWKEPDRLLTLVTPLIAARGTFCPPTVLRKGWTDIGLFDISSTQIRDRLRKGLFVAHLLPHAVMEYIHVHHLYGAHE